MKKLYNLLKIALGSSIGVFIGHSIWQYCDYKAHPDLYAITSAPWYLSILTTGLFTIITVTVILAAMWIIRKKINDSES